MFKNHWFADSSSQVSVESVIKNQVQLAVKIPIFVKGVGNVND